jgi:hypothetical protein
MRLSKLQKLHPSAIDKCAMVFVRSLAVEKKEIEGVLQMRGAFVVAFTNQK